MVINNGLRYKSGFCLENRFLEPWGDQRLTCCLGTQKVLMIQLCIRFRQGKTVFLSHSFTVGLLCKLLIYAVAFIPSYKGFFLARTAQSTRTSLLNNATTTSNYNSYCGTEIICFPNSLTERLFRRNYMFNLNVSFNCLYLST